MIGQLLEIAGSLGLFLFGMKIMSEGIQKTAGNRMKAILRFMTGNRFAAVFTGVAITAIIQSSSATTVMIVSFVNAGLMNLTQSIGVILGANIGTTVTGWLVALLGFKIKVSALAIPAIGIGFPFLFIKKLKRQDIGEILIGFGLLFLGLSFLKDSVPDISQNPEALYFLTQFSSGGIGSILLFLLAGTLVTIIVQSSSAAMAITLTMAYQGWISYPAAAALVLGQNIGTTVTAYLASIGTNTTAKRASRAHILFNVIGSLWVVILFNPFLRLVDFIVPGDVYGANSAILLPAHLAMYHTVFNVINTVLFMPFIPAFAKLIEKFVKGKQPEGAEEVYTFTYISSSLQDTPELYLITLQDEIFKMAELISNMFSRFSIVFNNPDKNLGSEVKELKTLEELSDQMQHELSTFMVELVKDNLNPISARNVNAQARIVNELESIGDSCFSLILLTERKYNNEIQFPKEAWEELNVYMENVQQYIDFIKDHLNRHISTTDLNKAIEYERTINDTRNQMRDRAQIRLGEGSNVTAELMLLDFTRHLEHIGDYSINIAEALVSIN
ncbi:MAG: Na/Pi cotransporter family protein [Bacteroidetes bacterium]|nr:Na/Pi cotransporter family protein [Bacteroidota bacterium]